MAGGQGGNGRDPNGTGGQPGVDNIANGAGEAGGNGSSSVTGSGGGAGGASGQTGGAGGNGGAATGGTVLNTTGTGGTGAAAAGNGLAGPAAGDGGGGGGGGNVGLFQGGNLAGLNGNYTGGNGGNGGAGNAGGGGGGGGGGAGGYGVVVGNGANFFSTGTATGGSGGAGGAAGGLGAMGGAGGNGGVGLYFTGGSVQNRGTITGGTAGAGGDAANGGTAGSAGQAGAGIAGSNINVTNFYRNDPNTGNDPGTISGGFVAGSNTVRGYAIDFTGGINTLTPGIGTLNGGLRIAGSLQVLGTVANNLGPVNNGGTFDISGTTGGTAITTLSGAGTTMLGAQTLTITAGSTTSSGAINGSGGLSITGGTQILSGASIYTGTTAIVGGILNIQNATTLGAGDGTAATGTSVANGATLQLQGGINVANEALAITGANGLNPTVAVQNVSGDNTFGGPITFTSTARIQSDAGTLTLTNTVTGDGSGPLYLGGAGNGLASGDIATGPPNSNGLVKDGTGTWTLSGNNSFNGVGVTNGTLRLESTKALGTSFANVNGGTLDVNGGSAALTISNDLNIRGTGANGVGALTGTGTAGVTGTVRLLGDATVGTTNATDNLTLSRPIIDLSGNGYGLTKVGAGTLTLTGANTYTGATTINGGTLLVSGTGSLSASSAVAVNAGGGLGGNGTVAGSVTVNTTGAVGGTISAGATALSDIGTLDTGALTLSGANAVFREDVTSLTMADKIVVKGAVTLAGTLDLHLGKGFASSAGQGFVIIDNDNPAKGPLDAVDGSFTSLKVNDVAVTLTANNTFAFNNHTYQIDYQGGDGNDVAIRDVTAPPAPPATPAPPPPSLQQDAASGIGFAQAITGNVLTNDGNASSLQLAAVQFAYNKAVSVPASGSVQVLGDHGLLTVSADGSYRYQPTSLGGDAFTETVRNADGGTAQTTLSFNVAKAAIPASLSLAFALTDATFDFRNGHDLVTAPNGTVTDLTGVGTISFTDGTVQEKDGSPLVDDLYYAAKNLDVWRAHVDPDTHYAAFGWKEGRDPSAVFSTKGYLTANPDVAGAGTNPLNHYDQFGWHEGRSPSPNFSAEAYLAENPDVARAGVDPLMHYLSFGQAEDRFTFPGATVAQGSGDHLYGDFDATFYLKANTDVAKAAAASGINADSFAFTHFLTFGANEGRDPDAFFSTKGYLAANPDVASAGFDPLLHYQLYGWRDGRDPSASFHTQDYLAANPDVAAAHIDPLMHYLQFGMAEGRHLV